MKGCHPFFVTLPLYAFLDGVISRYLPRIDSSNNSTFHSCLIDYGLQPASYVPRGNSTEYKHLNYQWQLKPPFMSPAAYILVITESDVSAAIACGRHFKVKVVARSGGHSFEKYSFGDKDSAVVDLRLLDDVLVNKSDTTVTVGPGALLGPLSWELWVSGKYFLPTGYCPTVGISGIATGGGYGNFARMYGLTVDYMLEIRMINSFGFPIKVNKDTNQDLFWALRGGGAHSFGIVTSMTFKILQAPPLIAYISLTYEPSMFPQVFDSWQRFTNNSDRKISAELDIKHDAITVWYAELVYSGRGFGQNEKLFPPTVGKTTTVYTFEDFLFFEANTLSEEILRPNVEFKTAADLENLRHDSAEQVYQKRKSFFVSNQIDKGKILQLQELIAGKPDSVVLWMEAYGGAINDIPANETAYVHRGAIYNVAASYKVRGGNCTANDPAGLVWVEKFFDLGKDIFNHSETYQNYVDGELPDFLQRYYGTNLRRLVEIKRKYDPDNYFSSPQSIPMRI